MQKETVNPVSGEEKAAKPMNENRQSLLSEKSKKTQARTWMKLIPLLNEPWFSYEGEIRKRSVLPDVSHS